MVPGSPQGLRQVGRVLVERASRRSLLRSAEPLDGGFDAAVVSDAAVTDEQAAHQPALARLAAVELGDHAPVLIVEVGLPAAAKASDERHSQGTIRGARRPSSCIARRSLPTAGIGCRRSTDATPTNRSGLSATAAATSSLLISGRPARSRRRSAPGSHPPRPSPPPVDCTGTCPVGIPWPVHRRNEANISCWRNRAVGCCIHTSITVTARILPTRPPGRRRSAISAPRCLTRGWPRVCGPA
jgi:hypothetical protein